MEQDTFVLLITLLLFFLVKSPHNFMWSTIFMKSFELMRISRSSSESACMLRLHSACKKFNVDCNCLACVRARPRRHPSKDLGHLMVLAHVGHGWNDPRSWHGRLGVLKGF